MKDYQARVIEETDQLKVRLNALFAFIEGPEFSDVDKRERRRLRDQSYYMEQYLIILLVRSASF